MPRLSEQAIQKFLECNQLDGPWKNPEWLATLLDLREARSDLKRLVLSCVKSGWTHRAIQSHAEHLQEKYGFIERKARDVED